MTRRPPAGGRLDVAMLAFAAVLLGGCGAAVAEAEEEPQPVAASRVEGRDEVLEVKPKYETLEEAIDLGLRLLVERDFDAFVERFHAPQKEAMWIRSKAVPMKASEIAADEKAIARVIDYFEWIGRRPPRISENGTKAMFDLRGSGLGLDWATFYRIDGVWYPGYQATT